MGEFDLIARFFTRPVRHAALGVGDDCALLAPAPGMQLAVSSDMLVEGRHFFADVDPETLGHKALAVNLSDLAACGARPLAFTLALALPCVDEAWLQGGPPCGLVGTIAHRDSRYRLHLRRDPRPCQYAREIRPAHGQSSSKINDWA